MKILRFILGDQLSCTISSLHDLDGASDVVLMVEVGAEATYAPHHKQKIALVLSAMRHFAGQLRAEGIHLDYVRLDDAGNTGSFTGELSRALVRHAVDWIVITEPGEWRVWEILQGWQAEFGLPVEVRPDTRFLCSRAEFANWAAGRKELRMEYFYRFMRRKTGWLMAGDQPEGGKWNYDVENRQPIPRQVKIPALPRFAADVVTQEVIALTSRRFPEHFGELEPFGWAVTRPEALMALELFIAERLPDFGAYQDAMRSGDDFLFHSVLSPYLNLGLLLPAEVCQAALQAYRQGAAPLSSVEGFLRQILGWREYIRGMYWLKMPAYRQSNFFEAQRPLPEFYWTGETELRCLRLAIQSTRRSAYAHHIQRLMVTGNFALLAGLAPAQVEEWYLAVYADAFEWVELPNTHGMALHADGGMLASKPYAASGAYIDRMSDYCAGCAYSPKIKLGAGACPFNYLYWYFLISNETRLQANPRLAMPYRTLARMTSEHRSQILRQAEDFLSRLKNY